MYDAIVVGARVAGSPTAMLLARRGYKVLLAERATFPSDVISGLYIRLPGAARLNRWGLLDRVAATGAPPIERFTFDVGPFALVGAAPPAEGVAASYMPRRRILDPILAGAAVEAGAELRTGFAVQELLWEGNRVVGIRGRSATGTSVTERARVVIGADGPHSFVARSVQAPLYNVHPTLTCSYQSYWSGVAVDGIELYVRDGRFIVAGTTNEGLVQVTAVWPIAQFKTVRADIEGSFLRTLDEHAPGLAERVRAGRREERFYGMADFSNFFRTPFGPGWALVGDAGYHKDPITAQGIADALAGAELLAEALDIGVSGRRPLDEALRGYQRRRDEAVAPMYDLTVQLATLAPPPPPLQDLLGALRGNQHEIDRFLGTTEGTVPIPEFFAPENVGRIIAAGSPARAA
ncbi:MAG: FAD-dependent monooxygenase [Chloroflexota bacterium]|nr:FAD-dependent monooxygenase [Chloroflexota bacterium]